MTAPLPAAADRHGETRYWGLSALLLLPIIAVYLIHFVSPAAGHTGTGFLQYDQIYYMANAREHFDPGTFSLFYGLPFSPFPDTPQIYVQVTSLLLGSVLYATGADPGHLYVLFGLIAGLGCIRVAVALFARFVPLDRTAAWLGLVCFVWGGGALAVSGLAYAWVNDAGVFDEILHFDPVLGYWFLNFGRNLYFAAEAFYHLLFFSVMLLLLKGRHTSALAVMAILSVSHPFTGLQCLLVVAAWAASERLLARQAPPSWRFLGAVTLMIGAHLAYYLWFLNTSEEHRALQQQWVDQVWTMGWETALAAYLPVALLAVWSMVKISSPRETLAQPANRLLLVWFGVSLALANHELLIPPMQPLHFTRGYVWTPLFLLGAPALVGLFQRLLDQRPRLLRIMAPALLLCFMLSDNLAWFGRHAYNLRVNQVAWGFALPDEMRAVFRLMNRPELKGGLVLSNLPMLNYLATAYTPLRAWWSHGHNTPHADVRRRELQQFFVSGNEPHHWRDRLLVVAHFRNNNPRWPVIARRARLQAIYADPKFRVYVRRPAG